MYGSVVQHAKKHSQERNISLDKLLLKVFHPTAITVETE